MAAGSHGAAAVVGAQGFLGRALVAALEADAVPVVAVTRADPALLPGGLLRPELRTVTTVYWAASSINPLIASQRPDRVAADLADFAQFLDAVHAGSPQVTVVLLSSGGTVYGTAHRPPHTELTEPHPVNEYGRAKLAMESLLHEHDVTSVVVRIANAYGPGQQSAPGQGVIGHWLRALRASRPVTVYGDLATVRDYVHVDDVVGLLTRLHGGADVPRVLNLGSGRPTTLATVVDVLHEVVGHRRLEIEMEPRRPFDVAASWLDVSLARRALGWEPSTPLVDGVQSMWAWLTATEPMAPS